MDSLVPLHRVNENKEIFYHNVRFHLPMATQRVFSERYFVSFWIKGSTVSAALKGVETKIKRDNNFQKEAEETKAIIFEDKP